MNTTKVFPSSDYPVDDDKIKNKTEIDPELGEPEDCDTKNMEKKSKCHFCVCLLGFLGFLGFLCFLFVVGIQRNNLKEDPNDPLPMELNLAISISVLSLLCCCVSNSS